MILRIPPDLVRVSSNALITGRNFFEHFTSAHSNNNAIEFSPLQLAMVSI
jgi:hypothetical protein